MGTLVKLSLDFLADTLQLEREREMTFSNGERKILPFKKTVSSKAIHRSEEKLHTTKS